MAKKKSNFLYFDTGTERVFRKAPEQNYESFTPTKDLDEGYLVFVRYSTYDSGGENPGYEWSVIDLYPDLETADATARLVASRYNRAGEPKKADGSKVYEHWYNWGQSFKDVSVIRVKVEDEKEFAKRTYYY